MRQAGRKASIIKAFIKAQVLSCQSMSAPPTTDAACMQCALQLQNHVWCTLKTQRCRIERSRSTRAPPPMMLLSSAGSASACRNRRPTSLLINSRPCSPKSWEGPRKDMGRGASVRKDMSAAEQVPGATTMNQHSRHCCCYCCCCCCCCSCAGVPATAALTIRSRAFEE
jgi:hypothetical protein